MSKMFQSVVLTIVFGLLGPMAMADEPQQLPVPEPARPVAQPGIFNFNPPGARALGMGATFIGIADDATAAETNPAGLINLSRPEISAHFSYASTDTEAIVPFENVFARTESFEDSTVNPSFLSYVRPLKRFVVSGYYQQLSNFRSHEEFQGTPNNESLYEFDSTIESVGMSGALRLGRVAFGASIRYSKLRLDLSNQQATLRDIAPDLNALDPTLNADPVFASLIFDGTIDDHDEDLSLNAGILVNPDGALSFGLVYKQGMNFEVEGSQVAALTVLADTNDPPLFVPGDEARLSSSERGGFFVPKVFGAGLAYRPPGTQWVLGLDLVRINYSDIKATRFGGENLPDDETEIHVGAEYGFTVGTKKTPVFLRAGFFNNPDHDGTDQIDSDQEFITIGGGFFLNDQFQLDGALAVSEDTTQGLLSFIWHFEKKSP